MRIFSRLSLALSWVSVAALVVTDAARLMEPSRRHVQAGSAALILIGCSYCGLQLSMKRKLVEMLQGMMLGLAFVLWGSEQLLPGGRLVTLLDETVVAIFVLDLGVIITDHLRRHSHEVP